MTPNEPLNLDPIQVVNLRPLADGRNVEALLRVSERDYQRLIAEPLGMHYSISGAETFEPIEYAPLQPCEGEKHPRAREASRDTVCWRTIRGGPKNGWICLLDEGHDVDHLADALVIAARIPLLEP